MKAHKLLILLPLLSILACDGTTAPPFDPDPDDEVRTVTHNVSGFDAIHFNAAGSLLIKQTGEESLTITAKNRIHSLLRVEVRGTNLHVELDESVPRNGNHDMGFRVTVRELRDLDLGGVMVVEAMKPVR